MKEYNGIINLSEPDDDYSLYLIYSSDACDNSIYIGVSSNCKQRVYKHSKERKYKRNQNKPLYIWMNDLIDNQLKGKVLFRVIETNLKKEIAFEKEILLIEDYKSKGFNVLNISEGGKGNKGNIPWNKGKTNIYNEEYLNKLSQAHLGKKSGMINKKHSKETKALLVLRNAERKQKGWINPRKKQVFKYNNDNILLETYSSLEEAGNKESVSPSSIGEWCRKEKQPKNGFIYSYIKIN